VCFSSSLGASGEDKKNHREAEKILREAKQKEEQIARILLLGAGDSGKSTVIKQMRVIHKKPWSKSELESYRQITFGNIVDGLREILDAMTDFELRVEEKNVPHIPALMKQYNIREGDPFPPGLLPALTALWNDEFVKQAYARANEAALPDNLPYFYNDLPRFFDPNFIPNNHDIFHCRARTTGMTETVFHLRGREMHMIDVGGQKSERRKWINFFQDVTSILFLVSLSGYDQCLIEDKDANQMQDAMAIWDSICHSQWFTKTALILFLNKTDLFEEKLKHSDIKNTFPDYDGPPNDPIKGREYFQKRFVRLSNKSNRLVNRDVYTHFTNATDTALLQVVLVAVEDITLRDNLSAAALL